jgi:hypothetical protein
MEQRFRQAEGFSDDQIDRTGRARRQPARRSPISTRCMGPRHRPAAAQRLALSQAGLHGLDRLGAGPNAGSRDVRVESKPGPQRPDDCGRRVHHHAE